jgi:hypothetical protein
MLSAWIKGTGGIKITPKGGRWLSPWGRIDIGNAAGVAVLAKALPDMRDEYNCFAVSPTLPVGDNGQFSSSVPGKNQQKNLTTETRFVPCKNNHQ